MSLSGNTLQVWIKLEGGASATKLYYCHAVGIEVFGGNVSTVAPEDSMVEAELDELSLVPKFLKGRVLEQRREVDSLAHPVAELAQQRVSALIFNIFYCQHGFILLSFYFLYFFTALGFVPNLV